MKATAARPKMRFSWLRAKGIAPHSAILLERQQQRVFAFGMKMCGDVEDAQEVAQDTLLSMVRSGARLPRRGFAFRRGSTPWLVASASRNAVAARGHPRSTSRSMRAEREQASAAAPSPEQALLGRENARLLWAAALDQL